MKKLFLMILFCVMVVVLPSYGSDALYGFGDHFSSRGFGHDYDGPYYGGHRYPFYFTFPFPDHLRPFLPYPRYPYYPYGYWEPRCDAYGRCYKVLVPYGE